MSITVGLDFGTHQTKICVEDSTDSNNKTHRFITFRDNDGNDTLFLPSIVQINEDNTVSYGFVDESRCKKKNRPSKPKPDLYDYVDIYITKPYENLIAPKLKLPPKPKAAKEPKEPRLILPIKYSNTKHNVWKKECTKAKLAYNNAVNIYKKSLLNYKNHLASYGNRLSEWTRMCNDIKKKYEFENKEYIRRININNQLEKYHHEIRKWEEYSAPESLYYRYFKLPIFVASEDNWDHTISAKYISVWYLAYVILMLNKKYGEANYSIQMGIPTTYDATGKYRNKAYQLLFSAYDLAENKFSSMSEFCSAPYYELVSKTDLEPSFDRNKVIEYGMMAIPEAYASLSAVTRQKSLRNGMHFLVDIGGGTTDIAFFTITSSLQPDIHIIDSMPKGINYILEKISKNSGLTLVEAQDEFRGDNAMFKREVEIYKKVLTDQLMSLRHQVTSVFRASVARDDSDLDMLFDAFKNRQITYCGGGGTYESLHVGLGIYFNDLKTLDRNMLAVDTIVNSIDDNLFPILSTSYGLSIELDELPRLTPLNRLFNHIQLSVKNGVVERNDDM